MEKMHVAIYRLFLFLISFGQNSERMLGLLSVYIKMTWALEHLSHLTFVVAFGQMWHVFHKDLLQRDRKKVSRCALDSACRRKFCKTNKKTALTATKVWLTLLARSKIALRFPSKLPVAGLGMAEVTSTAAAETSTNVLSFTPSTFSAISQKCSNWWLNCQPAVYSEAVSEGRKIYTRFVGSFAMCFTFVGQKVPKKKAMSLQFREIRWVRLNCGRRETSAILICEWKKQVQLTKKKRARVFPFIINLMKWTQTVATANWDIVVVCGHQRFSEPSVAFPLATQFSKWRYQSIET